MVVNEPQIDAFILVQLCLLFDGVLVELLLQLLVRVVDAHLLERVVIHVLETENVQAPNESAGLCTVGLCELVQLVHDVVEEPPVPAEQRQPTSR